MTSDEKEIRLKELDRLAIWAKANQPKEFRSEIAQYILRRIEEINHV
jgi:hypothetical protein